MFSTGRPSVAEGAALVLDGHVPPSFRRAVAADFAKAAWLYGRYSTSPDEPIKAFGMEIAANYQVVMAGAYGLAVYLLHLVEDRLLEMKLLGPGHRIIRVAADGRTDGMTGYVHQDHPGDGFLSVLYYINEVWKPEWNGPTRFYRGDALAQEVAFVPGRFAVFQSKTRHCSTPPTSGNTVFRQTLSIIIDDTAAA